MLKVETSFWLKLSTKTLDHGISSYQELVILAKTGKYMAFWSDLLEQYTMGLLYFILSSM